MYKYTSYNIQFGCQEYIKRHFLDYHFWNTRSTGNSVSELRLQHNTFLGILYMFIYSCYTRLFWNNYLWLYDYSMLKIKSTI